jgi:hypothetical protein
VTALATKLKQTQAKNAELIARLETRERIHTAVVNDLNREKRAIEDARHAFQRRAERLQRELERHLDRLQQLEEENRRHAELTTLLKEEIAWFKSQVLWTLLGKVLERGVGRSGDAVQ